MSVKMIKRSIYVCIPSVWFSWTFLFNWEFYVLHHIILFHGFLKKKYKIRKKVFWKLIFHPQVLLNEYVWSREQLKHWMQFMDSLQKKFVKCPKMWPRQNQSAFYNPRPPLIQIASNKWVFSWEIKEKYPQHSMNSL